MKFDATWIQAGELGLAFVVIILCAFLIRYTISQSAAREERLMAALSKQQQISDKQGDILQQLANHVDSFNERLDNIEKVIEEKLRSNSRRKSSTK